MIASFGILFAGCKGPDDAGSGNDTLVFTDSDMAQYRQIADSASGAAMGTTGTGTQQTPAVVGPIATGSGTDQGVTLDLSMVSNYAAMRQGAADTAGFQVTNEFLNVREKPSTGAAEVERLDFGATVTVTDFVDSQWAKVKMADGKEGYVAERYLSKVTSEERLADEKKQYENMYYVSFGFVNMRKTPEQSSEKVGEIPGQTIIKPISVANGWAKVTYNGTDGYVSMSYLAPFMPNFVVRQDTYTLPVLQYRLTPDNTAQLLQSMGQQIAALRQQGYSFMTFTNLHDLLLAQQQRDVRLDPKKVIVGVSGVTPDNIKDVSSALNVAGVNATLFINTQYVGLSGITEKTLLTMMANGFDIQSGTHTGDDLRALTNSQAELELRQSRQLLEEFTHKTVFAVAYPEGGVNDRIAQIAADAGYLFGVGDDADRTFSRSQLLRIPAMSVFSSMTTEEVTKFVTGE